MKVTLDDITRALFHEVLRICPAALADRALRVAIDGDPYTHTTMWKGKRGERPASQPLTVTFSPMTLMAANDLADLRLPELARSLVPFENRWYHAMGLAYEPFRPDTNERLAVARGMYAWLQGGGQ